MISEPVAARMRAEGAGVGCKEELNWIIKRQERTNDSADACFLVMNSRKINFIHHNFIRLWTAPEIVRALPTSSLSQSIRKLIGCHLQNCQREREKTANWNSRSTANSGQLVDCAFPSPQFWLALWHSLVGPWDKLNLSSKLVVRVERFPKLVSSIAIGI